MAGTNKYNKLGWVYIIALSCIALSIIIGQFFLHKYISRHTGDLQAANVAEQQRMLSQKISKMVLKIQMEGDSSSRKQEMANLKSTMNLWEGLYIGLVSMDSDLGLQRENSPIVQEMFKKVDPHYMAIAQGVRGVVSIMKAPKSSFEEARPHVESILSHETQFVEGMGDIVSQYEREAQAGIARLKKGKLIFLLLSLGIIVAELLFIFRPIARNVNKTVAELVASEKRSVNMASEMSRIYEELAKSYQDLEAVNLKPETPMLYAGMNSNGIFSFFSGHLQRLLEYEDARVPGNIKDFLISNNYTEEFVAGLIDIINDGHTWNGEIRLTNESGDFCWLEVHIIPVEYEGKIEHKIIARNVTEIKEAKMRSREINREKIEKRVREQQYRSVLILEGQEEERQRLGMEIHDGMGQMLTALNLSLESITPSSSKHTVKRLEDTKALMKSILQEVRRISFNLIPSSLNDFGIVPAIKKFCAEVNNISAVEVLFENKTRFVNRLEQHVENNLYRIIQEGVNNAIKYAHARKITVVFEHIPEELTITIKDNGRGFNYEKLQLSGHFELSGHGIFNMKERAAFINGIFELFSEQGKGTKIVIKLPLDL